MNALELQGISKRFGSVTALDGADFVLARGEVHGLLGENGAGKSTLMHVAFGMVRPDQGIVRVAGVEQRIDSPEAAKAAGLGMVHQHFTSIPAMTVAENLWLAAGRIRHEAGAPPRDNATAADRLRARLWQGLGPGSLVEGLSVAAKQRLEILMALATGAEILLLDEPTAVLAPPEVDELLRLLRDFAAGGGSAVLITHKLGEVAAGVDRVTVLRRGRVVVAGAPAGLGSAEFAAAMVGEARGAAARAARETGEPAVGESVVEFGALAVRAGEVLGIAAVEGNGERELLRQLAGVDARPASMQVAAPVAFIPEDRTTEGLIPAFSLTENVALGLPGDSRWTRGPWIDWSAVALRTGALLEEFDVRAAGPGSPVRTLSGGNQQKLVFARALERRPRVLIAENPTRGLDVLATRFVHERLREAAAAGLGVVVYSTDLDEVLQVADRVVVMYRGALLPVPPGAGRDDVGAMMVGAHS
ncbi:MAG: ABC transporter ATP-binding protein [Gemmatimonadales bacterium]